jgi:hypothetical protein
VTALFQASFDHGVRLMLKRSGGVDDDIRPGFGEGCLHVRGDIQNDGLCILPGRKLRDEPLCLIEGSSGNQQLDIRLDGQRPGDMTPKISVAADDENAFHDVGFSTIRVEARMCGVLTAL